MRRSLWCFSDHVECDIWNSGALYCKWQSDMKIHLVNVWVPLLVCKVCYLHHAGLISHFIVLFNLREHNKIIICRFAERCCTEACWTSVLNHLLPAAREAGGNRSHHTERSACVFFTWRVEVSKTRHVRYPFKSSTTFCHLINCRFQVRAGFPLNVWVWAVNSHLVCSASL